jgi:hypothetical protein
MATHRLAHFGGALLLAIGGAAAAASCEDDDHQDQVVGVPTGSDCPTGSTLTYANFGQAFFASYCQRCHGSTVTGLARMGAPEDHAFDTLQDIRFLSAHIDQLAAAGPESVNTAMPPDAPAPAEAERRQLGEWLACDAPE